MNKTVHTCKFILWRTILVRRLILIGAIFETITFCWTGKYWESNLLLFYVGPWIFGFVLGEIYMQLTGYVSYDRISLARWSHRAKLHWYTFTTWLTKWQKKKKKKNGVTLGITNCHLNFCSGIWKSKIYYNYLYFWYGIKNRRCNLSNRYFSILVMPNIKKKSPHTIRFEWA